MATMAGGRIIQACAERLAAAAGKQGLVARLKGDEFAAVLPYDSHELDEPLTPDNHG